MVALHLCTKHPSTQQEGGAETYLLGTWTGASRRRPGTWPEATFCAARVELQMACHSGFRTRSQTGGWPRPSAGALTF